MPPLRLATFNVKDLLDRTRLPDPPAHLDAKLAWIAAKIGEVDADVLGLQEVGSRAILDELVRRLERGYGTAVMGTVDKRGIGCALLSRRPVLSSRVHTAESLDFPAFFRGDPPPFGARIPLRRGVVHARVAVGGGDGVEVDVFVAHFKSRRPVPLRAEGGEDIEPTTARARSESMLRSLVQRAAEALYVRGLVDARLAASPGARVVVMGDLNDVGESSTLAVLRAEGEAHEIFSCARLVAPDLRYSVLHGGERAQIDHVLATKNMFERAVRGRFHHEGLRDQGDEEWTVDSDHAPFSVDFEVPSVK
jgi:endonuclease/exonuclease/phosphatase family metal-dependent hydrolase